MVSGLRKILSGISIPQEYVCIGLEELSHPVNVYLESNSFQKEVSNHLFLGYKPLVIGLLISEDEKGILKENDLGLRFEESISGFRKKIASLKLRKISERKIGTDYIIFYEGVSGKHSFISSAHQIINRLLSIFKKKKPGNVELEGNLYDQVRIAYSAPRKISLITTSDGSRMNLFPTDLHGVAGSNFYLGSLRIAGEACNQVMQFKKLVISEIDASQFQSAYSLGKNHMQPMKSKNDFDFSDQNSKTFGFPLPKGTGTYRELEVIDYFDVGIHRIFIYSVIHGEELRPIATLAHIHQYYAQWRINQKLETKFLLR